LQHFAPAIGSGEHSSLNEITMSEADYEKARVLIEKNPDMNHFVGPRNEALVSKAEGALQLQFPPIYRRFVLEYGCGGFGSSEFYGVSRDEFVKATVPNGVWLTLDQRRKGYLPTHLLLVSFLDDGEFAALDTRFPYNPDQCPVIVCAPGIYELSEPPEKLAEDFGGFFLTQVIQALQFKNRI
jgi:antitoxin YobK